MNAINADREYLNLVNHILNHETFNMLKHFPHHGTLRIQHSIRVSYLAYKIAKKFHLDYKAAAISGLLHDFYLEEDDKNIIDYIKFQRLHPKIAACNSSDYFNISKKEINIIETHMFPFTKPSRYIEGWVVSGIDKIVGTYEHAANFKNKIISLRVKYTKKRTTQIHHS